LIVGLTNAQGSSGFSGVIYILEGIRKYKRVKNRSLYINERRAKERL
jgi:hypothetical protein